MIINLKGEVWKDFSRPYWRHKEKYKVSNLGRVISYKKNPEGELFTPYTLSGYKTWSCTKESGKTDLIYVHRVVAELFLEADETRPLVIHKNYDKVDNRVENLQYVNKKERFAHNQKNPTVLKAREKARLNPKFSKLSPAKVRMIKKKVLDPNRKTRMRIIAKQFGISEMQLYRIKSGENWGHIKI